MCHRSSQPASCPLLPACQRPGPEGNADTVERWRELTADLLWEESKSCGAEGARIPPTHGCSLALSPPRQVALGAGKHKVENVKTCRLHLFMPAEPVPSTQRPALPLPCPGEPCSCPAWHCSALASCCRRLSAADYGCQDKQDSATSLAPSLPTRNLLGTTAAQHSPCTRAHWHLSLLAELAPPALPCHVVCAPHLSSIPAVLPCPGATTHLTCQQIRPVCPM